MNKAILLGRLTKDPELRYSQSAEPLAIARFSIAVARRFKREGEPDADFLNCIAFGKQAENIEKFFSKGRMISVVGHIQTGSYENNEGRKVYTMDIIVDEFYFTGEKKDESRPSEKPDTSSGFQSYGEVIDDDDLPF